MADLNQRGIGLEFTVTIGMYLKSCTHLEEVNSTETILMR